MEPRHRQSCEVPTSHWRVTQGAPTRMTPSRPLRMAGGAGVVTEGPEPASWLQGSPPTPSLHSLPGGGRRNLQWYRPHRYAHVASRAVGSQAPVTIQSCFSSPTQASPLNTSPWGTLSCGVPAHLFRMGFELPLSEYRSVLPQLSCNRSKGTRIVSYAVPMAPDASPER